MEKHNGLGRVAAIVLAAGQGKRMRSDVPKQYLVIGDKPILYYSLAAFEESVVDEIILVAASSELAYCQTEIVEKYGFTKVKAVVAGGAERYHSVYAGLCCIPEADAVLIHDGARPFLAQEIIRRNLEAVYTYGACVTGVPSKDTVKLANAQGFVETTPNRDLVWIIQTPQTFKNPDIRNAYEAILYNEEIHVTDDAMVWEQMVGKPVKLVMGSYENIKITTPDDLKTAQVFVGDMHSEHHI